MSNYENNKSVVGLIQPIFLYSNLFWNILVSKLSITIFAICIYSHFSPFLDAQRYLNAPPSALSLDLIFNRTLFTDFIYSYLKLFIVSDFGVHLFTSAIVSYILWYVFKRDFHYLNKFLFVSCLALPHFMIWSGIVGKEALAICGFLLLIRSCVDLIVGNKTQIIPLLIGLFLALIIRPHYALAYIYLLVVSFIISQCRLRIVGYLSPKTSLFVLFVCIFYIIFLLVFFNEFYSTYLLAFMDRTQSYFLAYTNSNANRWDIDWRNPSDFIFNLGWGLPISIIGPTFSEAVIRPIILPVFLEGCFSLLLLCFIFGTMLKFAINNSKYSSVIIWGFIPAILLGLLINYSFGIFNAGSAIRYKQSLAPLFYFYPLLLMGAINRIKYLKTLN